LTSFRRMDRGRSGGIFLPVVFVDDVLQQIVEAAELGPSLRRIIPGYPRKYVTDFGTKIRHLHERAQHKPIITRFSLLIRFGCPNSWPVIGDGTPGNIRRNNQHQNKWREMNLTDQTFYGGAKLVTGRNCSFIRHSAQLSLIDCWTL
jgi:hypothetical protein